MSGVKTVDRQRDHQRVPAPRDERRAASPDDLALLAVLIAMGGVILILVVTMGASLPY